MSIARATSSAKSSSTNSRSIAIASLSFLLTGMLASGTALGQCPRYWTEGFGDQGVNGTVYSMTEFDDGTGPALYAGGVFITAGGVSANRIAKWDGSGWSALGSGLDSVVYALAVFDDGSGPALYAGGLFTAAGGVSANRIAKWDGTNWFSLGSGMERNVRALAVFDDGSGPALFAGGDFITAGGASANHIAKWDGASWSALGSGLSDDFVTDLVHALAVFDDGNGPALYAGGSFTSAGGIGANRVAKWNGTNWSALGSGVDSYVRTLAVFDEGSGPALYAGGDFTSAGGVNGYNRIAKWDGAHWSALGSGLDERVRTLKVYDDGGGPALYAGGDFTSAGGVSASRIAKWDGSGWSALGSGLSGAAYALVVFDDGGGTALYAGGFFTRISKWYGANWSALGLGVNSLVQTLAVFDDGGGPALYAGGIFTRAGGVLNTRRIAKWDGAAWSGLGSGIGDPGGILAMAIFDDGEGPALYAAGLFSTAGGFPMKNIAKWDGASWTPLVSGLEGQGPGGDAYALEVFDDGSGPALYAAGNFTTAGGVSANRIAKWDGVAWSPLGSGMERAVRALAVFDDGSGPALYAGGEFTLAGGVSANNIARWDGTSWSALGSGVNDDVLGFEVFDDGNGLALYANGTFTTAGGVGANRVAKWDGASWSALGSGMSQTVYTLEVFDDGSGPALYAGGSFASNIAKWDGAAWSLFEAGTNGSVRDLAVFDDGNGPALYAGGSFSTAGGVMSENFAIWQVNCPIPKADPSGIDKTRFVSFRPSGPSANSALRVNLVSLHHVNPPYTGGPSVPFTSFEGQVRWVGPPTQYVESTSNATPFRAATLQCTPHYQDWSTVGLLHVTGSGIVPSSIYEVVYVAESCIGVESSCTAVSAPLTVSTRRWADVAAPYSPPSTTAQPDLADVAALVSKFRSAFGAPIKARALLAGNDAFGNINSLSLDVGFSHVAACVDAFRGGAYPYAIQPCP